MREKIPSRRVLIHRHMLHMCVTHGSTAIAKTSTRFTSHSIYCLLVHRSQWSRKGQKQNNTRTGVINVHGLEECLHFLLGHSSGRAVGLQPDLELRQ